MSEENGQKQEQGNPLDHMESSDVRALAFGVGTLLFAAGVYIVHNWPKIQLWWDSVQKTLSP